MPGASLPPFRLPAQRRDLPLLFALALLVNTIAAAFISRPGYVDAYYYFGGALQLARGLGFTEPYIWSYLALAPAPAGPGLWPSHLYWMPLTSLAPAPFIAAAAMFLDSPAASHPALFRAAQAPFVLLAALLPLLSYQIAWLTASQRRHALAAGALTLFTPFYFLYWPNTDSFALHALLAAFALFAITRADSDTPPDPAASPQVTGSSAHSIAAASPNLTAATSPTRATAWRILAGLSAGLAHLARADGLLVLLVLLTWTHLRGRPLRPQSPSTHDILDDELLPFPSPTARRRSRPWFSRPGEGKGPGDGVGKPLRSATRHQGLAISGPWSGVRKAIPLLLAYLLLTAPWFARNIAVAGSPLPPNGLRTAWLVDYNDIFTYAPASLTPARFLAAGLPAILAGKLAALSANFVTLFAVQSGIVAFPFVLLGLWRLRRRALYGPAMLYALGLFLLMTFVFTFPGARGGYFHSGAALLPFFYPAALVGLDLAVDTVARRRPRWQPATARRVFTAALVAFAVALSLWVFHSGVIGASWRQPAWNNRDAVYAQAGDWLTAHGHTAALVAVNNPPGWYYLTGRPAIVIPNGSVDDLLVAMHHHAADWLVLDINHPAQLAGLYLQPASDPRLRLHHTLDAGNPVYLFERVDTQ